MFKNLFSITEEQRDTRKYLVFRILGLKFKKRKKINHIYLLKDGFRKEVRRIKGLKIIFTGSESLVEIGCNPIAKFQDCQIICGNNSFVKIGSSNNFVKRLSINSRANNSRVIVGDNVSTQSVAIINENEPNLSVTIGEDCKFSNNIYIRPTDAHTIYDIETGKVLNPPCDIKIGNHVWCGRDVKLLKGANIPNGFIVGANSIVTKSSVNPENCSTTDGGLLVGIPAKVIKTGCTWSALSTHHFLEAQASERTGS